MPDIEDFKREIVRIARCNIGETAWNFKPSRQAKRNPNVKFGMCEPKCDLFVYEILLASLIDIGTPHETSNKRFILRLEGKLKRPYTAIDWFNGIVPMFEEVDQEDVEGGDVVSNGSHVGIVSEYDYTISATLYDGVVENDFGWRDDENYKYFSLCQKP